MEYDDNDGADSRAFYASSSYSNPVFNYFREELFKFPDQLTGNRRQTKPRSPSRKDNNPEVIPYQPGIPTNKDHGFTRLTAFAALLSQDRLAFILRYALVYVAEPERNPEHHALPAALFATKAIERNRNAGVKKGIITKAPRGGGKPRWFTTTCAS